MKTILVIIFLIFLIKKNFDFFVYKSVNNINDKRIQFQNNFISNKNCDYLSKKLLNHKYNVKTILSSQFDNTYGILVKFQDNKHTYNNFKKYDLEDVYNIFKKIKDPNCNAFVFNVLIVTKQSKEIKGHYDSTLNIRDGIFNRRMMPKWVSVIYIKLPNKFEGGRLLLNKFTNINFNIPNSIIQPETGKYVKFRGDSYHKVESFKTKEDTYRISLVFEQYQISNIKIPFKIN